MSTNIVFKIGTRIQNAESFQKVGNEFSNSTYNVGKHLDNPETIVDLSYRKPDSTVKVSKIQQFLGILTKDQLKKVNNSGKLPNGMLLTKSGNLQMDFNLISADKKQTTIPNDSELVRNCLGFCYLKKKSNS